MSTLLARLARIIDAVNDMIGRVIAWTAVILVLVQVAVVLMRYVFGISSIAMQESLVYLFATLFMLGAAYTLLKKGHVRVDIFYRSARERTKAWVDLLGTVFLLFPICVLIWITAYPYVAASWAVREGSRETSGIQGIYLLKTEILLFAVLVGLQGLSTIIHALRVLRGEESLAEDRKLTI